MREIRIHGVSGTPPQDMLGVPGADDVERIVSYVDPRTGFYRTAAGVEVGWWQGRDGDGAEAGGPVDGVQSEAYSWGALTSSGGSFLESLRRAGWLSLLPLALVNVAYWARPGIDRPSTGRFWTAIAVRWAGLLMTAALIGSVCIVGIDLVAWQCFRGGGQVCSFAATVPVVGTVDVAGAFTFLGQSPWNHPARRVLAGTVLPLLVLAALWWLSRQAMQRYESVPDHRSGWSQAEHDARQAAAADGADAQPALDGFQPILRREKMWQGQSRVGRQQLLHVAVGLSVTVLYAALTLLTDPNDPEAPWWRVIGQVRQDQSWLGLVAVFAALGGVAAFVGAALSVQDGNDFKGMATDRPTLDRWARLASGVAVGLAAGSYAGLVLLTLGPLSSQWIPEGREATAEVPFVGFVFVLLAAIVAGLTFASRGGWWPWLAAALPLGLALITNATLSQAPAANQEWVTVASASLWIVAIVGLLFVIHRTSVNPRQAWGGAAPGVVLGAATVVALVFSASVVVGVAAVLNGPAPVTDLQSDFDANRSAGQVAIALGSEATVDENVTALGPVTLRGGAVCLDGEGLTVTSGTLAAQSLTAMPDGAPFDADRLARPLPDVVLAGGTITMPDEVLLLADSTLTTAEDCPVTTTTNRVVSAGSVPVTGPVTIAGPVALQTGQPPQELLEVPSLLLWFATLVPIWLVGALLIGALTWAVLARRGGPDIERQVVQDNLGDTSATADWDNARRRGPRLAAAYSHRLERGVSLLAVLTVFIGLAGVMGASTTEPPWRSITALHALGNAGLLVTIGLALAILWFASGVRRSEGLRRQAGIMWDVSTFWPRVAHPFGPPCYAERVVPEVTRRAREALAQDPSAQVILSGHSQGSTIAAAVASRLSDGELRRIRIVTYGSQLRSWFGRVFPAVFGPDAMGTAPIDGAWQYRSAVPDAPAQVLPGVADPDPGGGWVPELSAIPDYSLRYRLQVNTTEARWVNLFRRSDPLGFRVFSDAETAPAAPVVTWQDYYVTEVAGNHDLMTHSGYQGTAAYRAVVASWQRAARMEGADQDGGRRR